MVGFNVGFRIWMVDHYESVSVAFELYVELDGCGQCESERLKIEY